MTSSNTISLRARDFGRYSRLSEAHTVYGFYNTSCPHAEHIIRDELTSILAKSPDLAGPLLRLHFVDCFVGGCEASILLNSTANNTAEKDAAANVGLRGFDVIDGIKAKLEEACPGIVSCADIIALAARDSVFLTNGPDYNITLGRRDGNTSSASDVINNIPLPTATIDDLKTFFAKKNLTAKDLVVLSGAHTIGKSHCSSFSDRLYNFTGKGDMDPTLDANYTTVLKSQCKPKDIGTLVEMDPNSSSTFDFSYYAQVSRGRGLFVSDEALLNDTVTKAYVEGHVNATNKEEFFNDFVTSMVTMGKIGALTHHSGEIRKVCSAVNPPPPPSSAATRIDVFYCFISGLFLLMFSFF
ncbi:peroxidase 1-like [Typha latifolia]|uniref:peroxidase 1-like n=1 Tax=Typha latifolia TaxID=4733 RepID=UPI003C2AD762